MCLGERQSLKTSHQEMLRMNLRLWQEHERDTEGQKTGIMGKSEWRGSAVKDSLMLTADGSSNSACPSKCPNDLYPFTHLSE